MAQTEWNNLDEVVDKDGSVNAFCLYERIKKAIVEDSEDKPTTVAQIESILDRWIQDTSYLLSKKMQENYERAGRDMDEEKAEKDRQEMEAKY